MEEIALQFREELQELIDRYKTRLSVPSIMNVAQDVLHQTLSIKYHPELHSEEMAEKSWQSKCLWYKINADESAYKTGFKDGYNMVNGDTECID